MEEFKARVVHVTDVGEPTEWRAEEFSVVSCFTLLKHFGDISSADLTGDVKIQHGEGFVFATIHTGSGKRHTFIGRKEDWLGAGDVGSMGVHIEGPLLGELS
jgi:hypothetical protein